VATGGSTGVICNCHPDTCVSAKTTLFARRFNKDLGQTVESGYLINHDEDKCELCGTCIETCHFGATELKDGMRAYNKDKCMGCELCAEHCPNGALSIYVDPVSKNFYSDPDRSLPLDLDLVRERFVTNK
jgi:ferredoxin